MILKTLTVGPFASNCYIIAAEQAREGIVIDPGADAGRIVKTIDGLGLRVGLIVATHGHSDHVGAAAKVKEHTGAPFAIHSEDAGMLGHGGLVGMLTGAGSRSTAVPDRLLSEGDVISCGPLSFRVLYTPGHTQGGICLVGEGLVFSGDTLFNYGIGRTDFPGGSYEELMEGIVNKLLSLPDETVVYPGHGPDTTIGAERRHNPFILEHLRNGR
ncbi:MAG: MBL fold metallo-hydrolase [Chloroflexota bacterium]